MRCRQTRKMMSAYIDDELTPSDKEAFLLHIGKCFQCSRELNESLKVHQLFTKAERTPAPYGFTSRVMANLETDTLLQKNIWDLFTLQPFFTQAASVLLVLAVMAFGIVAGNHLVPDRTINQEQASIKETFALDVFQATPSDSIGGVYAGIMEANNEG
jgi:anti-sigma factor RsiW